MNQKGLAAILTSIQSAGVAPEVNLRNSMQSTKLASEKIHPGFETQRRCHQKFKNRSISGPTKRTYVLQKFVIKKGTRIENNFKILFQNPKLVFRLKVCKKLHPVSEAKMAFLMRCVLLMTCGHSLVYGWLLIHNFGKLSEKVKNIIHVR